jgi:tetratricopeptide (TPR) repeat protein
MAYVKIILGLLVWGVLFFYGGSTWIDSKREQTCTSEINKDEPNLEVVKERCLQTAEHYMENEDYGSASWFYLLAGEYEKNVDEVEAKITDDFYMNIGHSYMLKGDYEKAKEIYTKYPWATNEDFHYSDETIQPDFVILPKLYKEKKENIDKGLVIWNEIYEPIGKIVKASNAYALAKEEENNAKQLEHLKEYIEYAIPFKDKKSIDYMKKKKELAELYSYEGMEAESIDMYKEIVSTYETNRSKKFDQIDTILTIAGKYLFIADYNLSLDYYKKALTLSLDSNNTDNLPLNVDVIYRNIADTYKKMNKNKEALDYQAKSLKYIEEHDVKNYESLSLVYSNMAEIYYLQKDYNLSIESYTKSIELKKEELKSSEDYYRSYVFSGLQELHSNLAKNYTALNMSKKAQEIKEEYISFLEYEYETHYKLIAIANDELAKSEANASMSLARELKAIKYIKRSVETEWGSLKEENNEELYKYMATLKGYLYALDKNETIGAKDYIKYVESFEEFEEKVFAGENNNTELLAKSYDFSSKAYNKASDINKSKIYAHKSVDFMKKTIENPNNDDNSYVSEGSSYAYRFDEYTYNLWDVYHSSDSNLTPFINEYFEFKKRHYEEGSEELVSAYETVGRFFHLHKSIDNSIIYYKKALNEAELKKSENNYLIEKNIDELQNIYLDREDVSRKKSIKLMNELITWQENEYNEKYILARSYMRLGDIYCENNETAILAEKYNKSIELFTKYIEENNNSIGSIYALRDVYKKVSTYYIEQNKKEKAIASMQSFIDYVEKIFPDDKEELSMCYMLFSDMYALMNDEKNSKLYQEKSLELTGNLKNTEVVYEPR